jgi:D-serine deaminase-like pyridoxal phosphate-dependent protein
VPAGSGSQGHRQAGNLNWLLSEPVENAMDPRYTIDDPSELLSPSLLIYRDLVERNLRQMIAIARSPDRLRPHAKTHKMAEIVHMESELGISKHKCATIAEAEMLAAAGAKDVLLAYPLVGPNLVRFARLMRGYPSTTFRAVVDHPDSARALSQAVEDLDRSVPVLLDLEIGMGRTGIDPGDPAADLYALVARLPNLTPDGLHAYDGHINDSDPRARCNSVRPGQDRTLALRDRLLRQGLPVPRMVMGGTPSFPIHAALEVEGVECSPGTTVLHDYNYVSRYTDLPFTPAAILLTRVVSHPRPGRLCLDLGHKAVAADPVGARVHLIDVPEPKFVGHSEEHLVVDTPAANDYPVGMCVLAMPAHVCPTCALHRRVYVIAGGQVVDQWDVAARDRVIGV